RPWRRVSARDVIPAQSVRRAGRIASRSKLQTLKGHCLADGQKARLRVRYDQTKCTMIMMYIKSLPAYRSRGSRLDCLSEKTGHEAPNSCGAVPRARN